MNFYNDNDASPRCDYARNHNQGKGKTTMPTTKNSNANDDLREDFEEFWQLCRRRVEKKSAFREYQKARAIALKEVIHAAMAAYTESTSDRKAEHVKHPRTWLYGECWTDEIAEVPPLRHETAREMYLRHALQHTRDYGDRPH